MGDLRIDMDGQKFGRLTVTAFAGTVGGRATWTCNCECGGSKNIPGKNLRSGLTKSCGCIKKELIGKVNLSHGLSNSSTYGIYHTMISRCTLPSQESYERYGGSGISVCERWMESFENFLADMGERPGDLTLDRENPFGNYEPNNCRWADKKTQSLNTRGRKAIQMMKQEKSDGAQAAPSTTPKVTLEDIHAAIASEHYFTAADGVYGAGNGVAHERPAALSLMTFCTLVLRNGFTIVGKDACVSPKNFDANLGRKYAHEDAINQAWPLMGFALADRLHLAKKLRELIAVQSHPGTLSAGEYMRGMANGMILTLAMIENGEPDYLPAPPECTAAQPVSTLPPHQQRLIDALAEMAEMDDKIAKLETFLSSPMFKTLDQKEQGLLWDQHEHMGCYRAILDARIVGFK